MQQATKVGWSQRMVVLIDEILHVPLSGVPVQCNYQFCTESNTNYIMWPLLLNLFLYVLLFMVTLTTTSIPPKGQLSVLTVSLNIAFPHTQSPFYNTYQVRMCYKTEILHISLRTSS